MRDKGFRDEDLKAVADSLQPGTSAVIAIAEDRMIERLQGGLERSRSIARHTVGSVLGTLGPVLGLAGIGLVLFSLSPYSRAGA